MQTNTHLIPPPYPDLFKNGIVHPQLYLWDSWSFVEDGTVHLYCLALSRVKPDGMPLESVDRNKYPFHIRHFTSVDFGKNWRDEGRFLSALDWNDQSEAYTVWSGGIERLSDGRKLAAFTALTKTDVEHPFIQHIGLVISSDGFELDSDIKTAISSPVSDRKEILDKGYYLGPEAELGTQEGEEGGPILAWRDPFVFVHEDDSVSLLWAAKINALRGAIARATLKKVGNSYELAELMPAVAMPDMESFTQLECPKVVYDKLSKTYYLLISVCNRLDERQPESEVDKGINIYKSNSIDGPWESCGPRVLGDRNLFGLTVLQTDFENDRLLCVAPYTEVAGSVKALTFAPVFYIYLNPLRVVYS